MGRHSRRGPVPKDDSADITAQRARRLGTPSGDGREIPGQRSGPQSVPSNREGAAGSGNPGGSRPPGGGRLPGAPGAPGGPRVPGAAADPSAPGSSQRSAPGSPREGHPREGRPREAERPDGTPDRGAARASDGTPAHGVPRLAEGGPARGGHPEQREAGGGWGTLGGPAEGGTGTGATLPRQRQGGRAGGPGRRSGPRQEYLDAFEGAGEAAEDADVFASRADRGCSAEEAPATEERRAGAPGTDDTRVPAQRGGGKGRAFAGVAAAAVTSVLAVIVAGQVADSRDGDAARAGSGADAGQTRGARAVGGVAPSAPQSAASLTYEQKMGRKYPLGATLKGSGKFETVPGFAKAPGTGQKYRYRVDVERGLALDGELFAEAVQKTLNDDRSWGHGGVRTFERVSSGKPDFVITLASPGTTAEWCAKSGLDTTEDNVSCDSAATERVMINAYRWAQGSKTYGDKMVAYRQMLINHEVGHRLGHNHVTCQKDGELAPVMQQQTKFLDHDGIHCLPNPWPYPGS
ncbi:DUF3152 domain-containing protein [Streptomyces sp. NPDC048362]|uniref:DUF3152 domain-containing protein n=1 Tax=Streptomyces sp. NPDC048362 TaxID=3365539 RepID=UPI0037143A99